MYILLTLMLCVRKWSKSILQYLAKNKSIIQKHKWRVVHLVWKAEIYFFNFFSLYKNYTLLFALPCQSVWKPEAIGRGIAIRAKVEQKGRVIFLVYCVFQNICGKRGRERKGERAREREKDLSLSLPLTEEFSLFQKLWDLLD